MRSRARNVLTFAVLAASVSSFALLQSLIVPVLTTIQHEFDTDQATVTWVLTGYLLSASIATPLLGRIGDVVGKTRMLVVTLVALSLGGLLATFAPSIGWLIAARVVQGVGGGVLPLCFGIARDEFGARMQGAIGVLASLTAVGFAFGIVVAGPIVDLLGATALFWLPMIVTAVAAVAAAVFVPESPARARTRLPLAPAVLLALGLASLLLAISKGNQWAWASPRVLGLLVAAGVLLAVWVTVERRVPVPMIDMDMMRVRGIWSANVVALFVGFGVFASYGFMPQFIQTPREAGYGFGASVTESGHLILPAALTSFVVGFFTAPLVRRYGARSVIFVGTLVLATAYGFVAGFHAEPWHILVGVTLQGLGAGLCFSSLAGAVITAVPAEQTGVASGMNANIRTIGGSLGSAAMAGIVTAQLGPTGHPVEAGYTVGFVVLSCSMLLAAAAALQIPRHRLAGLEVEAR